MNTTRNHIPATAASVFGSAIVATLLAFTGPPASADQGTPTTKRQAAAEWSEDGLQKTEVKGLDLVYKRPDASLAGYTKVLLKPASVSFRRNWERTAADGRRIRSEDAQRIKDGLATLLHDEMAKELASGGYAVVESTGDDVLEVGVSIVDLYITAPDVPTASMTRTYALSVGEMTMIAELRDSASSDLIARIYDHAAGREFGRMRFITRVDNVAEARSAASAWARALRNQLDLARKSGDKPD